MANKAFVAVFVLLVIIIIILIIAAAWFLKRKRRNSKPKDPESANIGQEHVEFANNLELQNMQAPHTQQNPRGSIDITTYGSTQPRGRTQSKTSMNSRPTPRPSSELWRRRGFDLSTSTPAVIPEEADVGQGSRKGSATSVADSFIRRSRIGLAKTTPYEETSRPRLSLTTQQAISSPYAKQNPKPRLSVDTKTSRHAKVEDAVKVAPSRQSTSFARTNGKFQEHLQSPPNSRDAKADKWENIELSPPPRQSMQSTRSSWRDSFDSNLSDRLPASWGKVVANRFPLD